MQKWQIQEAKARMSELVKRAQSQPQEITFHGKAVAVVLSREEYDRLAGTGQSLVDFMRNSPLYGDEALILDREQTPSREIEL